MTCPNCGEKTVGDGYRDVIHCPNADIATAWDLEPDASPLFCTPEPCAPVTVDEIREMVKIIDAEGLCPSDSVHVVNGRKGGSMATEAQKKAARRNGRKGGRPRKLTGEPKAPPKPEGSV